MSAPATVAQEAPISLAFPSANCPVYAIAPESSVFDVKLLLEARTAHLDAMLLAIYGNGFESFQALNDQAQDNYLWACSYMAAEIRALNNALCQMRARAKS